MSYEDHRCPCGDRKERETMLCNKCVNAFQDHPEMNAYQDVSRSWDDRRRSAIALVSMSHKRKNTRQRTLAINLSL